VHKVSNNKATCHAISVGSATGPENVATMWKEDFEKLYNSNVGNKYRIVFEEKIKNFSDLNFTSLMSLMDVWDAISKQKCGKASGPDNIHMEAFIHGGRRLQLLLSCLFNLFLHYGAFEVSYKNALYKSTVIMDMSLMHFHIFTILYP